MRYRRDESWQRFGSVLVAGSPLKIFRTTAAGSDVLDRLEADQDIGPSGLVDRLVDGGAIHPAFDAHTGVSEDAPTFAIDDVTVVTPRLGGTRTDDGRFVVDDGSPTPVVGADLRLEQNRGPAAARNAARPHIEGALVAFVDADVELLDEIGGGSWLTNLLPHFDDPRVGLVAPRVSGEQGSPLDLGPEPARVRSGTRVSYVPGAAIVVRVSAFDDVGGFDEAMRFGEDVDLVWRLDQMGWRCRYEPASVVWHEPRRTVADRMRQNVGYGSSAAPLALRHPSALSPVRTNGWTASSFGLAAFGHPIAALALAIGSAMALVPKLPDIPARASFRLAMTGNVHAGRQYASALRRVWWPLVAALAIVSKRARVIAFAAVAFDPAATPTDVAYGWGVWKGMAHHRTLAPIIPHLTRWPGRTSG